MQLRISKTVRAAAMAIVVLLASPPFSFAYRPFTTEDAGVAGKGVFQTELSWDYLKYDNRDKDSLFLFVPIFGVSENLELSAEIPYVFKYPQDADNADNQNGIGDINLVGKYLLLKETENRPAIALKGAVKTSTGSAEKGIGSGDKDYSLFAVASKTLGKFTLHGMFGYTLVGDNGDENIRNIYTYGGALDYELTEKLHLCGEVTGNSNPDKTAVNDPVIGLLGMYYKISEKFVVDGGVRYGFTRSAPEWSTTGGITVTF
jgi:hypothetical protein